MASDEQQRVQLSLSLSTSPPHTISSHDADPYEPLKLIVTIKQTASPFPDRAITIMTTYSCLEIDEPGTGGAFFSRLMESPQITVPDAQCPAPVLPLWPIGYRITITRMSGDPDLMKRDKDQGIRFISIPPIGQGCADLFWELQPRKLLLRLGNKEDPIEDKMKRFLRPGDTYKIVPSYAEIFWWSFGSLDGEEGLEKKKIARWSLPDDMPLVRDPGEDDTDEVAHQLKDWVDLHNVNRLSSRSAVDDEQIPNIRKMRSEGWVFGEPRTGLEIAIENREEGAQFTIV